MRLPAFSRMARPINGPSSDIPSSDILGSYNELFSWIIFNVPLTFGGKSTRNDFCFRCLDHEVLWGSRDDDTELLQWDRERMALKEARELSSLIVGGGLSKQGRRL